MARGVLCGLESSRKFFHHFRLPCVEVAGDDVFAGLAYKPEVEREVVYRGYLHGKKLVGNEKMSHVSLGVHSVYNRRPVGPQGREVVGPWLRVCWLVFTLP